METLDINNRNYIKNHDEKRAQMDLYNTIFYFNAIYLIIVAIFNVPVEWYF